MNYLTPESRDLLETTLTNLYHDMEHAETDQDIPAQISSMSDAELENVLNSYLCFA